MDPPPVVEGFAGRLRPLLWVTDLFVGGSAATGDYQAGVSDLDLVAVVDGPIDADRRAKIAALHRDLDGTVARDANLGCVYLESSKLVDVGARHPTWSHGRLRNRSLSGIARAELVRYGFAVFGRRPQEMLPAVTDEDVRRAAQAELIGYWAMATRHPWWWLAPTMADLALTSMARGRHVMTTRTLLTKTAAIDAAHVPEWLRADLRARRCGAAASSPRLRTAWISWRDARRTTAAARRWLPSAPSPL